MKTKGKFSEEELLSLLDSIDDSEIEPELRFDSSVIAFAEAFKLSPGKDQVKKKQLYNLYKVWNKGTQKLSQTTFTAQLSNLIDHNRQFFLIDQDMFQIVKFLEEEKKRQTIDKSKSKAWKQHFDAFLNDTKLEQGTNFIELEILYFLYLQWKRLARKTATLGRRQFIKILDLHFELKAISAGAPLWVGLNDQIKNLITKQEVERWRKHRDKKTKRFFYPQKEWRQFALYWEEKNK